MKILIAENDPVSRRMLEVLCRSWGFEVTAVQDGVAACKALENEDAPPLAILDWMMPGMDGIEVTRKTRAKNSLKPVYIILLTARSDKKDVIEGLWADADDYITKPFNHQELRARIHTGERVVGLQMALAERVAELEKVLSRVRDFRACCPSALIVSESEMTGTIGSKWRLILRKTPRRSSRTESVQTATKTSSSLNWK